MDRALSILFLAENLTRGGTETHLSSLLPSLLKLGVVVRVLYRGEKGLAYDRLLQEGIKPEFVSSNYSLFRELRLFKLKSAWGLVHSYFYADHLFDCFACRLLGLTYIKSTRNQGHWLNDRSGLQLWLSLLCLRARSMFTKYHLVNSTAVVEYLVVRERVPRSNIRIIHNGIVDLDRGGNTRPASLQDSLKIISIGRLKRNKRFDLSLRLLFDLRQEGFSISLDILGEGPDKEHLLRLAHEFGVKEYVSFLGWVDLSQYSIPARAFLFHPSLFEGMSNSILMAMMYGLPVVCFKETGGNNEIVEDHVSGFLCSTSDWGHTLQCARFLCESEMLRRGMGEAARTRYLDCFTLEKQASNFIDYYSEVLKIEENV